MPGLLEIRGLRVHFPTEDGTVRAVDGVDISLDRRSVLGLVGESGCGKSVTALSILRLLPPPGLIAGGRILFEGRDILEMPEAGLRSLRGGRIGMVFQEPMASLNPVLTVGEQVAEAVRMHLPVSRREARERSVELLARVRIPEPARRAREHPHRLSGGMRQRAVIAMAIACGPALLLADEPTTALDTTTQAEILDLLLELQKGSGMSVLLIAHNLALVAECADRVAVMYASRIVEEGPAADIFREPLHPYTRGLLASAPRRAAANRGRLAAIPGSVPDPRRFPPGCRFHPRCPWRAGRCEMEEPALREIGPGRRAACHFPGGGKP
jgi:oligopeptide/dipeptide ABC transporter ATP-binding protein